MDLNQWIDKVGDSQHRGMRRVEPAALLLGEEVRTVYSWYRRERAPRFPSAMNIVAITSGAVDYNGIFKPFEDKARP